MLARAHGPSGDTVGYADAACTAGFGAVDPSGKDLSIGRSAGGNRLLEPTVAA
ncbi:hypothetical protein ACFQL4_13445 [Halosimplex aquaticum]